MAVGIPNTFYSYSLPPNTLMDTTSEPNKIEKYQVGDEVEVTLTGRVVGYGDDYLYVGPVPDIGPLAMSHREVVALTVTRPAPPTWRHGDVVVIRYAGTSAKYTFVRNKSTWRSAEAMAESDTNVSRLFRAGCARHVLRDGEPVTG